MHFNYAFISRRNPLVLLASADYTDENRGLYCSVAFCNFIRLLTYFSRCFLSLQESDFQSLCCFLRNPEEPVVLREDTDKVIYHSIMTEHKEDNNAVYNLLFLMCFISLQVPHGKWEKGAGGSGHKTGMDYFFAFVHVCTCIQCGMEDYATKCLHNTSFPYYYLTFWSTHLKRANDQGGEQLCQDSLHR